jgi:hypothetical protein
MINMVQMARLRWLLTMELVSEPERGESRYRVWLRELDDANSELQGPFSTVDELYAALLSHWDIRNQDIGG